LQGHYTQAVADFSKALELNPRYAKAYYNRGDVGMHQAGLAAGLSPKPFDDLRFPDQVRGQDLSKAIALKPKDVASYNTSAHLGDNKVIIYSYTGRISPLLQH
jgi:tetratricopeptide (TPR) repeat protein